MKLLFIVLSSFLLCASLYAGEITLTPNKVTHLTDGNRYKITASGYYEVTTNGQATNAVLDIDANATLLLNDCNLEPTTLAQSYYPVNIASNTTLELRFRGSNRIAVNASKKASPAIYANSNATIIFAEALDSTAQNTLFLRGCLDTNTDYPVATPATIQVANVSGTVRFRSGNITLAAVEDVTKSPYQIPALVRAKNISLLGARITAQICPYTTTHIDNTLTVNALFNCTVFEMTGGELITDGENKFPTDNALVANENPYSTTYAYNSAHFGNITNATTQTRSGGIIRAPNIAYLYGFQPNTPIPAVCFTNATNSIKEDQTADEMGCVAFSGVITCNQLQFNYAMPNAKDEATVLGLPLIPSEQGIRTPEFNLGLSHLTVDVHTQELLITLAFHVPEDNATRSKTLRVQVLHTHNGVQTIAFDGETSFERTSTTEPLTTIVRCPPPPSTEGTHAYTMRAYN